MAGAGVKRRALTAIVAVVAALAVAIGLVFRVGRDARDPDAATPQPADLTVEGVLGAPAETLAGPPREAVAAGSAEPDPTRAQQRLVFELPGSATELKADDLRFFVRVVGEDGSPVAGALARLEGDSIDQPIVAVSSADGVFEVDVPSSGERTGRVDAAGFGPALFVTRPGYEERESALVIELRRGATLHGRVSGASAGVEIRVGARAEQMAPQKTRVWTLDDPVWRAVPAADGTWDVRDLPARVDLEVELRDVEGLRRQAGPLRLEPGETRALDWELSAGARLRGIVLVDGAAAADVEVWLVHESGLHEPGRMTTGWVPLDRSTTGADGRFVFRDVGTGRWLVGPAPTDRPDERSLVPIAQRVEIGPHDAQVDVLVEGHRAAFIRGTLLSSSGGPFPGGLVIARSNQVAARSGEDGAFALGPLLVGAYEVRALGGGQVSDVVAAHAGDEGLVIRLRPGGSIAGRCVDAATNAPRKAEVQLEGRNGRPSWLTTGVMDDGAFEFDGLPDGIYDVVARYDGSIGIVPGVVVTSGAEVESLVVALAPAAELTIHVRRPEPRTWVEISAGGVLLESEAIRAGESSTVQVSAGAVEVRYLREEDRVLLGTRSVRLVAGEEMELVWPEAGAGEPK